VRLWAVAALIPACPGADQPGMGAARELPPRVGAFDANGRQHGRVRCASIHTSLGEVLDLSASGARIRRRRKLRNDAGSMVNLEIQGLDGSIRVLARVVWVRKLGLFRYEVGVIFEDINPQVRRALTAIARRAPANAVIGPLTMERERKSA
jgi:hypothetical protein